MKTVEQLNIKIFADGADKEGMLDMYAKSFIKIIGDRPLLIRAH